MDRLTPLPSTADAAWYALGERGGVGRYVVSTAPTRALLNRPEITGWAYTSALAEGVAHALRVAPFRAALEAPPDAQVCVLHLLRGGLNFGLREALHAAHGRVDHGSAFLSSQRARRPDGGWDVREDAYRKLDVPARALLLAGDVVATGTTLEHALATLLDDLAARGTALRRLVLVTIGGRRAEDLLGLAHERLAGLDPHYEGSDVVYVEGRFGLEGHDAALHGGVPGTDLVRPGGVLAPEFARATAEHVAHALERCVIYDAGSRAFDVPRHLAEVRSHWRAVAADAAGGRTLCEALSERWHGAADPAPDALLAAHGADAAALARVAAARLAALGGPA